MEDLQAFSVIKVGEGDERAAAILVVAGLAAPARTANPPATKPAAPRAAAKPCGRTVPSAVVPPSTRAVTSPWTLPRWARVALFSTALELVF